jgi:putative ABC transport system substrate-binding protein
MRRRDFVAGLIGAAPFGALAAKAQPTRRMRRIGIPLISRQDEATIRPFIGALETLGYVDGKTVAIEYHDAEGRPERLPVVCSEVVSLNPDAILAFGGDVAPSVKKATSTIPVVVVVSSDPVEGGLVPSLARPGGNITGLTYVHDLLAGKSIELVRDTAPAISRVAVLWNPTHADPEFRETQRAARSMGVNLQSLEVQEPQDFVTAFKAAEREQAEALIVFGGRFMFQNRQQIGEFAARNRLILVGVPSWLMNVGGLMSYGPNVPELFKRAATYMDKIFKGAKPADLPMQQPTTFELTISLKRAKELGIVVPPTVIARADSVLE